MSHVQLSNPNPKDSSLDEMGHVYIFLDEMGLNEMGLDEMHDTSLNPTAQKETPYCVYIPRHHHAVRARGVSLLVSFPEYCTVVVSS